MGKLHLFRLEKPRELLPALLFPPGFDEILFLLIGSIGAVKALKLKLFGSVHAFPLCGIQNVGCVPVVERDGGGTEWMA